MSSSFKEKGKTVIEEPEDEEEADVNEEQFQSDLQQAKMISRLQTTLLEEKPSNRAGVDTKHGLFEEELIL